MYQAERVTFDLQAGVEQTKLMNKPEIFEQ